MSQRVAIEAIIVSPSPRPGLSGCGVIPRPSSSTRTSTQPSPASAVSATRPRSRPTNAWMIAFVTASETASVMLLIASWSAPCALAKSATPRRSSATTAGSASTSRCQRGGGAAIIASGRRAGCPATKVNCVSVPVIRNSRWTEGGPGTSWRPSCWLSQRPRRRSSTWRPVESRKSSPLRSTVSADTPFEQQPLELCPQRLDLGQVELADQPHDRASAALLRLEFEDVLCHLPSLPHVRRGLYPSPAA